MLNTVHLRTFVDVMRTGSFAVTARRLGYTPSAVSQQISALERATGVQLFLREASGVRPTPAAQHVLGDTQLAMGSLQSVADLFAEVATGSAGLLRVGSFPTASQKLVPEVISRLGREYPSLQVRLDEGEPSELASMLRTQELDMAIVYQYDAVPEILRDIETSELLLTEHLTLTVPQGHRLAKAIRVGIDELAEENWITTRLGTAAVLLLNRLCSAADFVPRVVHQSNDYAVIQELVAAGLGVAIVPALGCTNDPRRSFVELDADRAARRVLAVVSGGLDSEGGGASLLRHLRSAARLLANDDPRLEATLTI